jgi:hypothetical protein
VPGAFAEVRAEAILQVLVSVGGLPRVENVEDLFYLADRLGMIVRWGIEILHHRRALSTGPQEGSSFEDLNFSEPLKISSKPRSCDVISLVL